MTVFSAQSRNERFKRHLARALQDWRLLAVLFAALMAFAAMAIVLTERTNARQAQMRDQAELPFALLALKTSWELRSVTVAVAMAPETLRLGDISDIDMKLDILFLRAVAWERELRHHRNDPSVVASVAAATGASERLAALIRELDASLSDPLEQEFKEPISRRIDDLAVDFSRLGTGAMMVSQVELRRLTSDVATLQQVLRHVLFALLATSLCLAAAIRHQFKGLGSSRMQYVLALEGANDGLVDWNIREGTFTVSDHIRAMLGETRATFDDALRPFIHRIRRADRPLVKRAIMAHFQTREPFNIQFRMMHRDGRLRWFRGRGQAHFDTSGRPVRMIGTGTEITELIETSRELTRANNEAAVLARSLTAEKRINALQRQFISMVSHEFRTPLTVIDGRAGQIMRRLETMAPDDVRQRLASIQVSVARLVKLIESVLNGARLEEGKVMFEPVRVDLAGMLQEASVAARELFPDHRVTVSLPDHGRHIFCDATLVRQVVGNLVGNAGKYSAPGGTIEIALRHETGEDAVRISVRDTGVGIPKDEMPRLFERFFRARTSAGRPGTGIGLHLVQQFVVLHGGRVEVESVEGKGSCFHVILPASQRNMPPPSAPEPSGNAAEPLKAVRTPKNDIAKRA